MTLDFQRPWLSNGPVKKQTVDQILQSNGPRSPTGSSSGSTGSLGTGSHEYEYRDRLRTWLEKMIDGGDVPGLTWLNEDRTIFRMPWKHAGRQDYNLEDSKIFMEWAKHSGRYREGVDKPEPIVWKTRLRCALNKMPDIRELPDLSRLDISDPYRVYELLPAVHKGSEDKIRRRVYKRERLSETFDPSESLPKQSRIHTAQKTPAHGLIMPTFYTSEPERAGTGSQKRLERTGSVGQGSNESDSAESTEIKFSKNLSIERILPTTPHLPQALLSTSTQHQAMLTSNWLAALIHCSPAIRADPHLYNSLCTIAAQAASSENLLHLQNQQIRRLETEKSFWNDTRLNLEGKISILEDLNRKKDEELCRFGTLLSASRNSSNEGKNQQSEENQETTRKTPSSNSSEKSESLQNPSSPEIYAPKILQMASPSSDSGHSESEIAHSYSEEIDITC
ncbi:Oidioi.mRNA.OKI2018_I69.PAR.g10034.t1.cds [Oikopleura dioica]|uniref:Oidioi.mRNA.OKI2018_I69.PAR.g10034.t1.cds n=1 Tax=Oikopleura dioica TaxID=34765 RepID=A0ABN7RNN0_OIKDI|nr:Oidioi.mRNA.OKI2018_I69.PAR.g10034.t1.cds [Oikopleura dioica]